MSDSMRLRGLQPPRISEMAKILDFASNIFCMQVIA